MQMSSMLLLQSCYAYHGIVLLIRSQQSVSVGITVWRMTAIHKHHTLIDLSPLKQPDARHPG